MIELNIYLALGLVEIIVMLIIAIVFMYLRIRKYKPYYEANTEPREYIKRYLTRALEYSRKYAQSLVSDAEAGNINAIKRRENMVARLNWLVLERDFVEFNKPNTSYWDDINFRITKMLKRWAEIDFIEAPPDAAAISDALAEEHTADIDGFDDFDPTSGGDISLAGPQGNSPSALRARIQYLEKQVRQLSSYKTLFYGLQKTYEGMQKSYKQLKKTIMNLKLEADDAERLRDELAQVESVELQMEGQLEDMKKMQERMGAEMQQLEAAYAKLEEDYFEQKRKAEQEHHVSIEDADRYVEELIQGQEIVEQQDNLLREFRGFLHSLDLDTDVKLEIDDKTQEIQRGNEEVKTCLNMLEMERERLQQELQALNQDQRAA